VRRQEGSLGWRVAQEREVMRGCAVEVSGATAERVDGRVSLSGKRMGDVKGLRGWWLEIASRSEIGYWITYGQFSFAISARLSMML
jgi:hypothetical protein